MTTPQLLLVAGLFVLMSPTTATAQPTGHIHDRIVDEITRQPSAGANVPIMDSAFGAETDPAGDYRIEGMQKVDTYRRHFAGSSMFVLANVLPISNPPSFYQINYGYRLTRKDAVSMGSNHLLHGKQSPGGTMHH
jgi:hypothetical protein